MEGMHIEIFDTAQTTVPGGGHANSDFGERPN
jgi:hypothetical protein